METAILSAQSALGGATFGAIASIATTWLSQHNQDVSQRRVQDSARREHLFRYFIDLVSKPYADVLTREFTNASVIVPLYALKAHITIFAKSRETVARTDEVLTRIIEAYYVPNRDIRQRPGHDPGRHDILETSTIACRDALTVDTSKRVRQNVLLGTRSTGENSDSRAAPATRPVTTLDSNAPSPPKPEHSCLVDRSATVVLAPEPQRFGTND